MSAPLLALDLGNSRLKACLLPTWDGAPSALLEHPVGRDLGPALAAWLDDLPAAPALAGLASVAAAELEQAVAERLRAGLDLAPLVNPDCGLRLALETPESTGPDRLYAARAAVEVSGGPCVVLDAGTALTVDAAAPGVFLGGAIAPGPSLLARALASGGARLPSFEPAPGAPALGRSTAAALCAGVGQGFVGAALHLVEQVAAAARFEPDAPVLLTGGARGYLEGPLAGGPRALRVDPLLVPRGLALCLRP